MTKIKDTYNVTHTGFDKHGKPTLTEEHVKYIMDEVTGEYIANTVSKKTISDEYSDSFYEALEKSKAQYENQFKPDSIVQSIIDKFNDRAKMGYQKYNNTLDRNDFSVLDWVTNTQEELMDAILYLEKLKKTLGGEK
jgi:hypothetical protein